MAFTIDCSCGRKLSVDAGDAGIKLRCTCGNVNTVPSLTELRRAAGLPDYEMSAADKVKQLCATGELPSGDHCARCGCGTLEVLLVGIECERPFGTGYWETVVKLLFYPLGHLSQQDYRYGESVGRELTVEAPLRMCHGCQEKLRGRFRKRELVGLLRKVPVYDELFREYPGAAVVVD